MSAEVDARGMVCPQPVIAAKKALESLTEGVVTVYVDNPVAKDNVVKFAVANQCGASVENKADHFMIKITKGTGAVSACPAKVQTVERGEQSGPVYLITQDTLGHGNKELGAVLMKSFFFTLTEKEPLPKAVMFMNSGVLLTIDSSPVLQHIITLSEGGVQIMSCGTCLDYYQVKERLAVGTVSNMYSILDTLTGAAQAITL